MAPTDPRQVHDDLLVTEHREVLAPDQFAEAAASEPATVGWVAFAFVFDGDGRVLLIRQPWADGWLEPGGALAPGETLAETVEREVREETGVVVDPVRPHAVDEFTVEHAETGETDGWTAVFFEAAAETTAVAEDPGLGDEDIQDVRWFDGLPADLYHPDLTRRVYRRCRQHRP